MADLFVFERVLKIPFSLLNVSSFNSVRLKSNILGVINNSMTIVISHSYNSKPCQIKPTEDIYML
jgi:hypothetical protein